MIRDMRRNGAQPKDTMRKAAVNMITGMGVVKTADMTVNFPTSETASNIYVVTKERIPSGLNTSRTDMSDYDEDFVNIGVGEYVGLERYTDGEKFATDQFKADDFSEDAEKGIAVSVGTDGLWMKASIESKYIYDDVHIDNGHKLIMIRVETDPVTNA